MSRLDPAIFPWNADPIVNPTLPIYDPHESLNPIVDPTDPIVNPTDPIVNPTDPIVVPTDPIVVPTNPIVVPTNPIVVPTQPIRPSDPILHPFLPPSLFNPDVSLNPVSFDPDPNPDEFDGDGDPDPKDKKEKKRSTLKDSKLPSILAGGILAGGILSYLVKARFLPSLFPNHGISSRDDSDSDSEFYD